MSLIKPQNGKERLIQRLTESLEKYRATFERNLSTTYNPGEKYPSAYLSYIEHYSRMFLWCPCLSPDTLVRLNASIVCEDTIEVEHAPQITEFAQLIDNLTFEIGGI